MVLIEEDTLSAKGRVTHALGMHINEGARLHVKVGATVEGAVSEDKVVKGREVEEVVEGLFVVVSEQCVLYDKVSADVLRIVCVAVPAEVVPNAILVVRKIEVRALHIH